MKNNQLKFDLEKILSCDDLVIATDYDKNLGYILDVNDNSYFYSQKAERDNDRQELFKITGK